MKTQFFNEALQQAQTRIAGYTKQAHLLLDKNEQSNDVNYDVKVRAFDNFIQQDWNRYPAADLSEIESKVAAYCNLHPDNIALANGSASIITSLLNYFALNKKNIIIAQPSYSLFEYHCKTYNIDFTPWFLTSNLEFDVEQFPTLDKDSVFIITSPNNPTGNSIGFEKLEFLLQQNPSALIIVDHVYSEFCDTDLTPLVTIYPNLIVLRSFSKAFPIEGFRLGYLCATPAIATMVRKLILQFSINTLTLSFANDILFDKKFQRTSKTQVEEIKFQRSLLYYLISNQFDESEVKVFPSEGNFILIKIHDQYKFKHLVEDLSDAGVKILNTSSFVLLENTFRVSIGNDEENEYFFDCFRESLMKNRTIEPLHVNNKQFHFATN